MLHVAELQENGSSGGPGESEIVLHRHSKLDVVLHACCMFHMQCTKDQNESAEYSVLPQHLQELGYRPSLGQHFL